MTTPAAGHAPTTVAVGYDGSEAAQEAVQWAAEYAVAAQYRLRVVHAWVWPVFTKNLGPVKGVEGSGLRHSGEAILAAGVDLARRSFPNARGSGGPGVESVLEAGLPAPVLRKAARDARLLVVSSRGIGGVLGQLAGSVCLDLAGSSPCPLMVIRRPRNSGDAGAPVVVGIDGTSRTPAALAGAAQLAGVLGNPLRLIHIDQTRGTSRARHGRHAPLHGQELLDHALEEVQTLAPELPVSGILREGHSASKELLAAAADAEVLVVGTHNREGGPGNTVTAVLNKARCNVLITR
ncbi:MULTISPECIES: universal stress protein [unclassified Arthrobacter]|uniref:universal stress protein n=1 Tax=unclassified Arthrobacter TaxID=235627 RepID=UPI002DFFF8C2|nr:MULTISPECIES: universal stress protein [unclassified Arthrobacter]MEC5193315.1 nucleotide-binding universal stress UspA family protein [Arthrobacter sp. MP_M4]MEC5204781.1 nucleotide-binding universal stress UspA family protein [Arthrobacter sp. MP_M7]